MGHSESPFHKPRHGAYVRSCRWLTGALPSKAAAASWSLTFLTSIGVGSKDATTPYYSCGARSKRRGIAGKAAVVRRYSRRLCPRLAQLTPEQRAIYPGATTNVCEQLCQPVSSSEKDTGDCARLSEESSVSGGPKHPIVDLRLLKTARWPSLKVLLRVPSGTTKQLE